MGRALSLLWQQGDPEGASTSKSCSVYVYGRTTHRSPCQSVENTFMGILWDPVWTLYGYFMGPCRNSLMCNNWRFSSPHAIGNLLPRLNSDLERSWHMNSLGIQLPGGPHLARDPNQTSLSLYSSPGHAQPYSQIEQTWSRVPVVFLPANTNRSFWTLFFMAIYHSLLQDF